jgi:hypothetical protein
VHWDRLKAKIQQVINQILIAKAIPSTSTGRTSS